MVLTQFADDSACLNLTIRNPTHPRSRVAPEIGVEKRLLLAFALMGAVLFITQYFYPQSSPQTTLKPEKQATPQQAQTPPRLRRRQPLRLPLRASRRSDRRNEVGGVHDRNGRVQDCAQQSRRSRTKLGVEAVSRRRTKAAPASQHGRRSRRRTIRSLCSSRIRRPRRTSTKAYTWGN